MAAEKTTEPDEVLTDEELQAAAAPEPDSANNNEAHKRTVVVAEDESVNRMDLVAMLEDNGYEVVGEAANGEEAVELTRKFRPSVVCMDVKMPRMDGQGGLLRTGRFPLDSEDLHGPAHSEEASGHGHHRQVWRTEVGSRG